MPAAVRDDVLKHGIELGGATHTQTAPNREFGRLPIALAVYREPPDLGVRRSLHRSLPSGSPARGYARRTRPAGTIAPWRPVLESAFDQPFRSPRVFPFRTRRRHPGHAHSRR